MKEEAAFARHPRASGDRMTRFRTSGMKALDFRLRGKDHGTARMQQWP
jgi:hypothetical protein